MKKNSYTTSIPQSSQYLPGKESISQEYDVQQNFSDMIFSRQEHAHMHNSYAQEVREMKSIESGDLGMLKTCWDEFQPNSYGILSNNRIRNIKNHCIILVAFASRAAIRGGVVPEIAYSLCDSYIQKIEDCNDSTVLAQLAHRAEIYFTELVIDANGTKPTPAPQNLSQHVEQCKTYIFSHLHQKITVQEIASALHLNANYLNDLFRKQENQSILKFILREKIKLAQNMLVYSNYSYSEIANYLGFSSQSHLGLHFKNFIHMTMSEYRAQYQSDLFH